jgi:putative transposase
VPRSPRAEYEPGIHHVVSRGNRRQPIYVDDADRRRYLATLARVITRMDWSCLAYCLMGNHVHLFVETRVPNLGRGMHLLHGAYAQYFNRRHDFSGHLFQERFRGVNVASDVQFAAVARYIARNPVEAALCSKAEAWPWNSYAAIVTGRTPTWLDLARLFAYLGAHGGDALRIYRDLVDPELPQPKWDSPL